MAVAVPSVARRESGAVSVTSTVSSGSTTSSSTVTSRIAFSVSPAAKVTAPEAPPSWSSPAAVPPSRQFTVMCTLNGVVSVTGNASASPSVTAPASAIDTTGGSSSSSTTT